MYSDSTTELYWQCLNVMNNYRILIPDLHAYVIGLVHLHFGGMSTLEEIRRYYMRANVEVLD